MLLDDASRNRQPQPDLAGAAPAFAPFALGKPVEDRFELVLRHAGAPIGDHELRPAWIASRMGAFWLTL